LRSSLGNLESQSFPDFQGLVEFVFHDLQLFGPAPGYGPN
jgi:hypothetical protein